MTTDDEQKPVQDWNKLAQEALDLWQNHLTNLANDTKLKEDMARMVAPMGQMFTQWSSMMQSTMAGMAPCATEGSTQTATDNKSDDVTSCADAPVPQTTDSTQAVSPQEATQDDGDTATATANTDDTIADTSAVATTDDRNTPTVDEPPTAVVGAEPTTEPVPAVEQTARGRASSPDGTRDLAQLASRLAQLERELDSLRPKSKRASGDAEPASDAADDGDVQRVAGANSRSNPA